MELRAELYGMNVDSLSSSVFSLADPCGFGNVDCWLKDALTGLWLFLLYTSVVIAFFVRGGDVVPLCHSDSLLPQRILSS